MLRRKEDWKEAKVVELGPRRGLPELEGAVNHGPAGVVEEVEGVWGELEGLAADGGFLIIDDGPIVAAVEGSK
ncbi:hypothetical protein AAC387_Pa12g1535 [Persea americana]